MDVVSLFSGAMGLDLGLERAGFETVVCAEKDQACIETIRTNRPKVRLFSDVKDIGEKTAPKEPFLVAGGPPCFVSGTMVLCIDGYKPIEDIVIGDIVLTHKGRWRRVNEKHFTQGVLVRLIKAQGLPGILSTEVHPFLARKMTHKQVPGKTMRIFSDELFIVAKDLLPKSSFISQILPPLVSDAMPEAFWKLVGRYLADGWLLTKPRRKKGKLIKRRPGVCICCGKEEKNELNTIILESGFKAGIREERTSFKFIISRRWFYEFLKQFGKYAYGKKLPGWVMGLPKAKAKALLEGYLSGDGHFSYSNKGKTPHWTANSTSKALALSMALLAQRALGVVCSIRLQKARKRLRIEGRLVNERDYYSLGIPFHNRSAFIDGIHGWKLVRKNETAGIADVYNIGVEEDESYVVDNCIVHNCQAFSTMGHRLSFDDSRGMLVFEFGRIVKELRPRFFVMENVKGLASAKGPWNENDVQEPGLRKSLPTTLTKTALSEVLENFKRIGYKTAWGTLMAADYGVPQFRERIIIIGSRDGEDVFLPRPTHFPVHQRADMRYSTLGDAIWYLRDMPGEYVQFSQDRLEILKKIPAGCNWKSLSLDDQKAALGNAFDSEGGRTGFYRRLAWGEPCPTLVTSPVQQSTMLCHPDRDRPLSVSEYMAIQQFQPYWQLAGNTADKYRQMGNAVPIGLAHAIGEALVALVNGNYKITSKRLV